MPDFGYTNFINTASFPVTLPIGLTWGVAQNLPTTYSLTYLINVQRTLGKNTTLEVGYNGSQSRKLANLIMLRSLCPGATPVVTRLPYPEFGAAGIQFLKDDGTANYNGLGTKLSQRFGTNLTTLFSYTWSKALDDGSAIRGPGNDFVAEDARCRRCDYGYSTFDVPHRFVGPFSTRSRFGKGQRFLNRGGILNQVVGGWQLSTISTFKAAPRRRRARGTRRALSSRRTETGLNCYAGIKSGSI